MKRLCLALLVVAFLASQSFGAVPPIKYYSVSVTGTSSTTTLAQPSTVIIVINDGPEDIFINFTGSGSAATSGVDNIRINFGDGPFAWTATNSSQAVSSVRLIGNAAGPTTVRLIVVR